MGVFPQPLKPGLISEAEAEAAATAKAAATAAAAATATAAAKANAGVLRFAQNDKLCGWATEGGRASIDAHLSAMKLREDGSSGKGKDNDGARGRLTSHPSR